MEDQFNADFQTTVDEILEEVYKGKFANKYIASFTPFLKRHRGHKTIEKILEESKIPFKTEYSFSDLLGNNTNPLRFDFVIFNKEKIQI